MKSLVILLFSFLSTPHPPHLKDQIPDLLIVGKDTLFLKSYPLEVLAFEKRPFSYGGFSFPDITCLRGYQATWKVIEKKLFLIDLINIEAPEEKIDLVNYFLENNYAPVVTNGMIFADWYSINLTPPRRFKYFGCVWKSKKPKSQKTAIRFEKGIMVLNKYKARKVS